MMRGLKVNSLRRLADGVGKLSDLPDDEGTEGAGASFQLSRSSSMLSDLPGDEGG